MYVDYSVAEENTIMIFLAFYKGLIHLQFGNFLAKVKYAGGTQVADTGRAASYPNG